MVKIFSEIFKERRTATVDHEINSAIIQVLKSLLEHSKRDVMASSYVEICDFIFFCIKSNNQDIQVKTQKNKKFKENCV